MPRVTNQTTIATATADADAAFTADIKDLLLQFLDLSEGQVLRMRQILTHLSLMDDHELSDTDILEE